MKNLTTTLLISSLLFAIPVLAGSNHDHGYSQAQEAISSEEAASLASKKVNQLANTGKIDLTWNEVEVSSIEQKTYSNGPEWLITFKNTGISDASQQTLYLFFTLSGQYLAANYTGT
jgi:hypothetical protein